MQQTQGTQAGTYILASPDPRSCSTGGRYGEPPVLLRCSQVQGRQLGHHQVRIAQHMLFTTAFVRKHMLFTTASVLEEAIKYKDGSCTTTKNGEQSTVFMPRVKQTHIYAMYVQYCLAGYIYYIRCMYGIVWQENHRIYGHIRCVHAALARTIYAVTTAALVCIIYNLSYHPAIFLDFIKDL
jgi:hypothetical protein